MYCDIADSQSDSVVIGTVANCDNAFQFKEKAPRNPSDVMRQHHAVQGVFR